jgi:hypothetical protein
LTEPALQSAFVGQRGPGVVAAEEDPDQAGSPAGVVAAQRESLVPQSAGSGRLGSAAGLVVGRPREAGGPGVGEQTTDGANGEAEGAGNRGGRLALAVATPDEVAQGSGCRSRHGSTLGKGKPGAAWSIRRRRRRGQTLCRD